MTFFDKIVFSQKFCALSIYMVNIIFFRKMIRKVVTSNFCPYNQDHNHPVKCNCRENCSKNDRCNLTHHAEMEGSFKKVIYGVIGPDDFVKNVHAKMKQINYNGGVYTLMMNTQGPINEDNTYDIINEIRTFEKLREVDPQGDFTPILLFYDKVDARDLACAPTANFCGIQQVVDSWRQEEENYSTLSCGA